MNILILTVKAEGSGVSADYVNHVERLLAKANITGQTNEFMKVEHYCITDNTDGLSPFVKTKQLVTSDAVTNPNWYDLEIYDIEKYFPELYVDEDEEPNIRVVNMSRNVLPLGGSQFAFMKAFPHSHARFIEDYDISDEEYFYLKDHKCEFIKFANVWDDVEVGGNRFQAGFSMHDAGKMNKIVDTFRADPEVVLNEYGDNVQGFIETVVNSDPLLFYFTATDGTVSPYYFSDEDQNAHLNEVFEEVLRPRVEDLMTDLPSASMPGMESNHREQAAAKLIGEGHDAFHTLVQFVEVRNVQGNLRDDRFLDINVL